MTLIKIAGHIFMTIITGGLWIVGIACVALFKIIKK